MGRAPCCEKMGLKKGPWTADEDRILISYINRHGYDNWRALPKRAGLLRCGKSCRLRWVNYLRPDIKRGNFTREEEETIIKLHQQHGNRWSLIAANLPGRTDNEIKNVWHTRLKKRLNKKPQPEPVTRNHEVGSSDFTGPDTDPDSPIYESSSDVSQATTSHGGASDASGRDSGLINDSTLPDVTEMDDSFWSEVFSGDDSSATSDLWAGNSNSCLPELGLGSDIFTEGGMDFWYDLLNRADGLMELHEF